MISKNITNSWSWQLFNAPRSDVSTETGSEDDGLLDLSDDDFFHTGSSSDDANADDEWTDRSTRYISLICCRGCTSWISVF